jgi:hypothetical protein
MLGSAGSGKLHAESANSVSDLAASRSNAALVPYNLCAGSGKLKAAIANAISTCTDLGIVCQGMG